MAEARNVSPTETLVLQGSHRQWNSAERAQRFGHSSRQRRRGCVAFVKGERSEAWLDPLKTVGAFIGWLSGAVAGVTAILYAFGFLATLAHQRLLGLGWASISRDSLWYVGLGGQVVVAWALDAILWLLLLFFFGEAWRMIAKRLTPQEAGKKIRIGALVHWFDRHALWFLAIAAMVLAGQMMAAFEGTLAVRNLLFAGREAVCGGDDLVAELAGVREDRALERAGAVFGYAALALGLGWYATPRLFGNRISALPVLICGSVALQALGAIPAAYGILVMERGLRHVVADGENAERFQRGPIWLVARATDGVWAWEPATRSVHWFAEGSFDYLRIGHMASVGSLSCSEGSTNVD